jgi:MoxR-like ATPase
MNISEVKQALPILMKHKIVPFLWGQAGVGKTQVVKQIAKENKLNFLHLHLATQEVGDLVGLLIHTKDGNVKHSKPEWFPTSGKGIVFLDECNRAHPDVLQAMFSFITEGTIHTHKLPEGWVVVAAGNYQTNAFNVTDTSDSAWMSRFCHIDFQPTKEEFITYAESKNAFTVADFIRVNPEMLAVSHKEKLNTSMITPDNRCWLEMISKLEDESEVEPFRYEIYSGIVGPTAAASFMTFKKKSEERLSGRDILENYRSVRRRVLEASKQDTTRFDVLNTAVEEIFTILPKMELDEQGMTNFKEFLLDVPLEMSLKISKKLHECAWKQKNKILNEPVFVELFKNRKLTK